MSQAKEYEEENLQWTPAGNESIKNKEKSEKLFVNEEKTRLVSVIAEAKASDNLLTIDAFNEMLEFETAMHAIEERNDATTDSDNKVIRPGKGTVLKFKDICKQLKFTDPSGGAEISKCYNTG